MASESRGDALSKERRDASKGGQATGLGGLWEVITFISCNVPTAVIMLVLQPTWNLAFRSTRPDTVASMQKNMSPNTSYIQKSMPAR